MSVEQLAPGTWRVGVYRKDPETGKRRWIRRTIHLSLSMPEDKQRKAAEREEIRLGIEVDQGLVRHTPPKERPLTVRDFAERWMAEHVLPSLSPVTASDYRFLLDSRILPALGDIPLKDLTAERITRWLNDVRLSPRRSTRKDDADLVHPRSRAARAALADPKRSARPLSERTVQHYYDTLAGMLDLAVQWDVLDANPCVKVARPVARKRAPRALDEDRAVQLLRCLADEEDLCFRAAVLLALLCGLRLGEVAALKFSDINWKKSTIDVSRAKKYTPATGSFIADPKTEASARVIALPAGMMEILRAAKAYSDDCADWARDVWVNEDWIIHGWNGAAVHKDTPSRWFRRFADRHGFQGFTFHGLRHTHASQLIASHVDVQMIASRLGHASPDTTLRIYAHEFRRSDAEAADAAQRLLDAAAAPDAPS